MPSRTCTGFSDCLFESYNCESQCGSVSDSILTSLQQFEQRLTPALEKSRLIATITGQSSQTISFITPRSFALAISPDPYSHTVSTALIHPAPAFDSTLFHFASLRHRTFSSLP